MFFLAKFGNDAGGGALPPHRLAPPCALDNFDKLLRRRLLTAIDGGVVWADCPPLKRGGLRKQPPHGGAVGSVGFCWCGSRPRTQIAPPPVVNPTGPVPAKGAQRPPPCCGVRPQPGAVFCVGRRPRPARLGSRALPYGMKKRGRAIGLRSRYALARHGRTDCTIITPIARLL